MKEEEIKRREASISKWEKGIKEGRNEGRVNEEL